jgi:hypothetical protein
MLKLVSNRIIFLDILRAFAADFVESEKWLHSKKAGYLLGIVFIPFFL